MSRKGSQCKSGDKGRKVQREVGREEERKRGREGGIETGGGREEERGANVRSYTCNISSEIKNSSPYSPLLP